VALAEEVKNVLRRGTVDRAKAKAVLQWLDQPAGKALAARMKQIRQQWTEHGDDARLIDDFAALAEEYRKPPEGGDRPEPLRKEDLHLVCFDYVSS
jgi:hypothetical protein